MHKVHSIELKVGDKVIVQEKASKGKLAPMWLGPFPVVEVKADSPNTLLSYFQSTSDICVLLKDQDDETLNKACITFMQITYPFVHEIELNFFSVMKVLAPSRKYPKQLTRRTRGLINTVGRLTNVLFGVCSDEDANFFYTNIQNFRDLNEKSLHFTHEQLRIVLSVVQDVNSTIHDLATDYQKTRSTIDRLSEQAKRMLNAIDILINFALNGLMHTSVYPPSELYHELREIQLTLPPTLELLALESHLALPELFRASTLSVVYSQQTLMFISRIPLLSTIPYNIYHNIPLPLMVAPKKNNFNKTRYPISSRCLRIKSTRGIIQEYQKQTFLCSIPKLYVSDIAEPHVEKEIVQSRIALACSLSEITTRLSKGEKW
ncbi:Envelope fusion protein [Aphis craccivora]|uniref:Envelope fusion protein n=1 Tax=Aphis craccivora TaxID=307492 RepID=A0A6G0YA16_APHCR|nr:Envelope fusion protein [Aphis craccivora]